jgi:hypothetical protein
LASFLALAVVAVCGGPQTQDGNGGTGEVQGGISASRVKEYRSLGELAKESTIVAVVRATGSAVVEKVHDIPFTVTTVEVIRGMRGTSAGTLLKVRQTGNPEIAMGDDLPAILRAGETYLLFLYPFWFTEGVDTGQYYVMGDAGIFAADMGAFKRLDPVSRVLPEVVTEADAMTAVSSR